MVEDLRLDPITINEMNWVPMTFTCELSQHANDRRKPNPARNENNWPATAPPEREAAVRTVEIDGRADSDFTDRVSEVTALLDGEREARALGGRRRNGERVLRQAKG